MAERRPVLEEGLQPYLREGGREDVSSAGPAAQHHGKHHVSGEATLGNPLMVARVAVFLEEVSCRMGQDNKHSALCEQDNVLQVRKCARCTYHECVTVWV